MMMAFSLLRIAESFGSLLSYGAATIANCKPCSVSLLVNSNEVVLL